MDDLDPQEDPASAVRVIELHRYLVGRPGRIEIHSVSLRFVVPGFAEPFDVPLDVVEGAGFVSLTAIPPFAQPQRSGKLFNANLGIAFRRPVPIPPSSGTVWRTNGGTIDGLCLRVRQPAIAIDLLEAAGVAFIAEFEHSQR